MRHYECRGFHYIQIFVTLFKALAPNICTMCMPSKSIYLYVHDLYQIAVQGLCQVRQLALTAISDIIFWLCTGGIQWLS